jgi:hypothetical protein
VVVVVEEAEVEVEVSEEADLRFNCSVARSTICGRGS